jgi:hypothetical protein
MKMPEYSPDALRAVLTRHRLTGSQAGRMLGVGSRAIRKWTANREAENATTMPESAWWLLLILLGELEVDALRKHIETLRPEGRSDSGD